MYKANPPSRHSTTRYWLGVIDHDHDSSPQPSNEPEKERIQNAGGSVMIQRVNGSLAVSRYSGDRIYCDSPENLLRIYCCEINSPEEIH